MAVNEKLLSLSKYLSGGHYEPRTPEEGQLAKDILDYLDRYSWKEVHYRKDGVLVLAILRGLKDPVVGRFDGSMFDVSITGQGYHVSSILRWKEIALS